MNDQHIASAFDRDLEDIQAQLMKLGGMVEDAIKDGAKSLKTSDVELAETVRKNDKLIDALDIQIQEECARVLALRQPIASDLRTVLSVMKVAFALERVGDYAKNMAKRTTILVHMQPIDGSSSAIMRMTKEVQSMLGDALDAFIRRDHELALEVRQRDHDVDQMYNALFREFLTFMMEDPRNITACMHLHFIAKNIERMGDHVTAIADQVIYLITGDLPEDSRPKANWENYQTPDGDKEKI